MSFSACRYILFIILLVTESCNTDQTESVRLDINQQLIDSLMQTHGTNLAILSCLRCDCFRQEYNIAFNKRKEIPKSYVLLGDSNCINLDFPFEHLPDKTAKRISLGLYNLVLFKRNDGRLTYKVLNVNESKNILKVTQFFFDK